MSEPQGSLITLMRFLEGHLSTSEFDAARRQLDTPDWQSAWQRLQLAAVETTLPVTTWEEPAVPAATLAAFLDGNLSLDEANQVEQHCWDSPELLREIVSTYRFMHVDASHEETTASHTPAATDRLLAMFPSADQPATAYDERTSAQPRISIGEPSADGNGQIATAAPTADLPVVINKDKRAKRRRSRTPAWMVYAATVAIGLGLGLGAVVLISLSRDKAVNPHQEIVSPSEGQEPTAPVEAPRNLRNGSETPNELPRQPDPRAPDTIELPSFDTVNSTPPDNSDPRPRPRPSPPSVVNNTPPQSPYRSLALEWDLIDGLLVARNTDRQPWHGAKADVTREPAATYATLPDSWARAKTNHGQLVLAADTQVQLDGTRDAISLKVARGRVAISNIPVDQTVRLETPRKSWIVQPLEADTAIGYTILARQSHLIVRRGRVSIGGTEITAGRQVALVGDELGQTSTIESSTKWFTRPEKRADELPAATRLALLTSRDVRADLAIVWRQKDHPAGLLAARWSQAIAGDANRVRALFAVDDKLRGAALHWLLSSNPNDPRVHAVLSALAKPPAGNTKAVRNVQHWLTSAHADKLITRADAVQMVAGLRSGQLPIRQISAYFLEAAFGKRVAFDPKAGPAAQQKAAREWTTALRTITHDRAFRNSTRN